MSKRSPWLKAGHIVEQVTATELDEHGASIAHHPIPTAAPPSPPGVELHVADLLPHERADVVIEYVSPHRSPRLSGPQLRAWGKVQRRIGEPSPHRVQPSCPAFGACGGCVWQHLDYRSQCEHKRERVRAALRQYPQLKGHAAHVAEVLAAPSALGYRNTGKYVVGLEDGAHPAGKSGDSAMSAIMLGGYRPRSHTLVNTLGCRLVEPVIDRAATRVRDVIAHSAHGQITPYHEQTRTGVLRYVVIRSGADGRVVVGLVTTSAADRTTMRAVAAQLCDDDEIAGVVWVRNDSTSGTILTGDMEPLCGRHQVREHLRVYAQAASGGDQVGVDQVAVDQVGVDQVGADQVAVDIGLDSFFQIHRTQAERMYREIASWVAHLPRREEPQQRAAPRRILDLYCGVGGILFALSPDPQMPTAPSLAETAPTLLCGIEVNPAAVSAAQRAADSAGLARRVSFHCHDLDAGISPQPSSLADQADLITVNPPRKGLSAAVRQTIAQSSAQHLIYVSCHPITLARDLAELVDGGWHLDKIQPLDLMPSTPHIETIVQLTRHRGP